MASGKYPKTKEHRQKLSNIMRAKLNKISIPIKDRTNIRGRPKGYIMSEEHRKKISNSLKGNKASSWKGGISHINKIIRKSIEYRLWREAVFKRDNYTCIWCGKIGVKLQADHIKRFSDYPEIRFAIDNGRTLCISCHKTTETYGNRKIISQ